MNRDIDAGREPEGVAEEAARFDALLEGRAAASAHPSAPAEVEELVADARYAERLSATLAGVEPRPHYLSRSHAMLRSRFFPSRRRQTGARRGWLRLPALRWTAAPAAVAAAVVAVVVFSGGPADPLSQTGSSDVVRVEPQPAPAAPAAQPAAAEPAPAPAAPVSEPVETAAAPPEPVPTLEGELAQLAAALQRIQENPQNVDGALLREVTARTASVAQTIDREPEAVPREAVLIYREAAETGRSVLSEITVSPGDEPALEAAQSVAEDGVVVAARYLGDDPIDTTPEATPEPTPEPTPEATPEPTPEATPEPAPEATPEPAGDGS